MRGLGKAATSLLAVPAAAAGRPPHDGPWNNDVPKTGVRLPLPLAEGKRPQPLMLMLEESDDICGPASIYVGRTALTLDDNGAGSGEFPIRRRRRASTLKAHWTVSCITEDEEPMGQALEFVVDDVDGEPVATRFTARLKQTQPAEIELTSLEHAFQSIGDEALGFDEAVQQDDAVVMEFFGDQEEYKENFDAALKGFEHSTPPPHPPPPPGHHGPPPPFPPHDTSSEELDWPSPPPHHPPPHHPPHKGHKGHRPKHGWKGVKECKTWKCVAHNLAAGVKGAAHKVIDSIKAPDGPGHPHRRPHHGPPPHGPPHDPPHKPPPELEGEDIHMEEPFEDMGPPPGPPGHQPGMRRPWPKEHMKPLHDEPSGTSSATTATPSITISIPMPPTDPALLLSLGIAGTFFLIFSFISLRLLHKRLSSNGQPRISRHRRETREERLARVSARRQRFGDFFRGIFHGLNMFEDKDEPRYEAGPGGRDLRDDAARARHSLASEDDMTMEQELASFRDAASMVSSLIAAEEGRTPAERRPAEMPLPRMPQTYQHDHHHSHRPDQHDGERDLYFTGYMSDTASLPPYESEELDASMVADGMQYTPGQAVYTPDSSPANSISGSDRLGYDNKD